MSRMTSSHSVKDTNQASQEGVSDDDLAVLPNRVIRIIEDLRERIAKDGDSLLERHTVLLDVRAGIRPIPGELHRRSSWRNGSTVSGEGGEENLAQRSYPPAGNPRYARDDIAAAGTPGFPYTVAR